MTRFVILAVVVVCLIAYYGYRAANTHFICPNCGEQFQVNFIKFLFAPHVFGKRTVTCPKCGKTSMLYAEDGRPQTDAREKKAK